LHVSWEASYPRRPGRVEIDGDTATVTLPSPMVLQRVEGSYAGQTERALKATYSGVKRVRLIAGVRPAAAVQSIRQGGLMTALA
jgi:hypothetical protein